MSVDDCSLLLLGWSHDRLSDAAGTGGFLNDAGTQQDNPWELARGDSKSSGQPLSGSALLLILRALCTCMCVRAAGDIPVPTKKMNSHSIKEGYLKKLGNKVRAVRCSTLACSALSPHLAHPRTCPHALRTGSELEAALLRAAFALH